MIHDIISYSAPAKVILSGEHAVLYGKPALVCAIDHHLTFAVWQSSAQQKDAIVENIALIVQKFLKKNSCTYADSKFNFKISSTVPVGAGLGSSAALSVAASAALLEFYTGKEFEKEQINNVAFSIEKVFHKNPSGADNSISCFGGLIYYRKEFEFLKTISLLQCKIPKLFENHMFLIQSGIPIEKTKHMIESVGQLFNKNKKLVEDNFSKIEKCAKKMTVALYKEDAQFFRDSIRENQDCLEKIGVVSQSTKELLTKLSKYGVGKVTGAGGIEKGSGYVLFFADDVPAFLKYAVNNNIEHFPFKQSHVGVVKKRQ